MDSKVEAMRDNIKEELKRAKDDLRFKIDEVDKFYTEQVELIQTTIERTRGYSKELVEKAKDAMADKMAEQV